MSALAFAGEELPGVDLIMPDIAFIEKMKKDLVGIVITHAHEDHIGALAELWPRLGVPVYATRFAAGLAEARRLCEPGAPKIPFTIVAPGARIDARPVQRRIHRRRPFDPRELRAGDPHPGRSRRPHRRLEDRPDAGASAAPTDEARLRELGDEGVLALICDSTNVLREGESPSEADVAATLGELVPSAKGRVVVTTFASNVARLRAAAEAGFAAGRQVIVDGPRDGARRRGGARMRLSRRRAAIARPGYFRPPAARSDRWRWRPAARASRARRWRASPTTSTRPLASRPATS